jgi:hypothetical protein
MDRLNILKIVLIFICIVIAQIFVTYLVLGGINAYYGIPLPYDFVYSLVVFSPLVCFICIKIIFNIFLGFIASGLAKKEMKNRLTWFLFTAILGLSALAILYLIVIHEKISKTQIDT